MQAAEQIVESYPGLPKRIELITDSDKNKLQKRREIGTRLIHEGGKTLK